MPYVPPKRTVNNHGEGKLFDRTEFVYDEKSDTFAAQQARRFGVSSSLRKIAL